MSISRSESEIFKDLEQLCGTKGYAHVIAYLSFKENVILLDNELKSQDFHKTLLDFKVVGNEFSLLIGLMIKNKIDFSIPNHDNLLDMIGKTKKLLQELHDHFKQPMRDSLKEITAGNKVSEEKFGSAALLREAIFYGGDSAYDFQYLSFVYQKYADDNDWLKNNKGFSIEEATTVVVGIFNLLFRNMQVMLDSFDNIESNYQELLSIFMFRIDDLKDFVSIPLMVIDNIVKSFCLTSDCNNTQFNTLSDFNCITATPIIKFSDDAYILFQHYSLAEALYEVPYYWMREDPDYINKAMINRGAYVENFTADRLEAVFGKARVHKNINIFDSTKPKKGEKSEIDVLVVFGNKALIFQAKGKRLTLDARSGNDKALRSDFQKSIQDAYDQGLLCSKLLLDKKFSLKDASGKTLDIKRDFSDVYILCVVPDNYPALNAQARQFLKYETSNCIRPPFIMDIFCLDVIAEMLNSPLYFSTYVHRRTEYLEKIHAHHEITVLGLFIKHNPWLNEDEFIYLDQSVSSEIDVAMTVRRLGFPGKSTPEGYLTDLSKTKLGSILKTIDDVDDPVAIGLGSLILSLGSMSHKEINKGLDAIILKSRENNSGDMSLPIDALKTGITFHCNKRSNQEAWQHLEMHCRVRKYVCKADSWYGVCITPDDCRLRFALKGEYPWVHSEELDELSRIYLQTGSSKL